MTHWHSAFFLTWKIYHMQLEHLRAGRVHRSWFMRLERKRTRFKVAKLRFHFVFCWACLIKSELANQALYCGLHLRGERELFLWGWSSSGKMPRLAHPCVKHIAGITWHRCLQVKLLLMSAVLVLLEEAWQDDGKKIIHPSSMNPSLFSSPFGHRQQHQWSWMVLLTWLGHHLMLILIMVFLPGIKDLFQVSLTSLKSCKEWESTKEIKKVLLITGKERAEGDRLKWLG